MLRIDRVAGADFRRGRHAEHSDVAGDCTAQRMQQIGMADQHAGPGILQDIADFIRLEMPVHRHGIGTEQHHRIGNLDEGDVVAHQHADAVALPDPEILQAPGNPPGTIGHIGMAPSSLTADDTEKWRWCWHWVFRSLVGLRSLTVSSASSGVSNYER
jgi:hypothetical protein